MTIATAARLTGPAALALVIALSGTQQAAAASRPSAPRSVAAKPGNATVRVAWAAPSSTGGAAIDRYAVQRATSSSGTWSTVAKPDASARTWTNTGLLNGHRYYFRVRAHNAVGWGPASTTVSAVPRTVPSAPQSPAASPGDTSVDVTWARPASTGGAAIDGYAVQRLDGTWGTVAQVSAATLALTVTELANGTSYDFRVRAHNVTGWSPASTTVGAVPRTLPSAPQSPAATTGDASATVTWSAPASSGGAAIDEYELQLSPDGVTWSSVSAGTLTQVTATGLQNGTQYHFRVRAHNDAGWSPASSEALATPGLPLPPTQVQGQPNASGIDFSWTLSATVSPQVSGYEVAYSFDGGQVWKVVQVSSSTTDYQFSGGYGKTVLFRIRAHNSIGNSPWTTTISAVAGLPPCPVHNVSGTFFGSPWFENILSWQASPSTICGSPATDFKIERIINEGPYVQIADLDASKTSYADFGATRYTTYWYRITPHNDLGDGPAVEVKIVVN
jgi:hypothetical protein